MNNDMIHLAERCEAATGPDLELDGSIWWATRPPDMIAEVYDRTGYVRKCIERDGSAGKALQQFFDSANPHCLARLAFETSFTASIDAARMLVPEGSLFSVRTLWDDDKVAGFASVSRYEDAEVGGHFRRYWMDEQQSNAATPALALCSASLRARALSTVSRGEVIE